LFLLKKKKIYSCLGSWLTIQFCIKSIMCFLRKMQIQAAHITYKKITSMFMIANWKGSGTENWDVLEKTNDNYNVSSGVWPQSGQ